MDDGLDVRVAVLENRVEHVEEVTEEIRTLSNTMVKMIEEVSNLTKSVNKLDDRVLVIETQPRDKYKHIVNSIISTLISLGAGYLLAQLFH